MDVKKATTGCRISYSNLALVEGWRVHLKRLKVDAMRDWLEDLVLAKAAGSQVPVWKDGEKEINPCPEQSYTQSSDNWTRRMPWGSFYLE